MVNIVLIVTLFIIVVVVVVVVVVFSVDITSWGYLLVSSFKYLFLFFLALNATYANSLSLYSENTVQVCESFNNTITFILVHVHVAFALILEAKLFTWYSNTFQSCVTQVSWTSPWRTECLLSWMIEASRAFLPILSSLTRHLYVANDVWRYWRSRPKCWTPVSNQEHIQWRPQECDGRLTCHYLLWQLSSSDWSWTGIFPLLTPRKLDANI